MNRSAANPLKSLMRRLRRDSAAQTHLIISAIFIALIAVLLLSLDRYWQNTLQPRLYRVAETQAKILAESQAAVLVETLEHTDAVHLRQALIENAQEMLVVEDPAIGERFIRALRLEVDYSTVKAPEGSLNIREGDQACSHCFQTETLLTRRNGEILGVAAFAISDGYYRTLSAEMKSKLFAESSIVLILLIAVWTVMTVMFHRLHAAKQLVEASDQAKARFMANVTHELRTPLNAILGYTQLYRQDEKLMQQHGRGIEAIDRSADHLLQMINDILEFSRANEEVIELHPDEIDLANFLDTLVEMMQVSAQLKGIEFIHHFSDQLPATVITDGKRLRQILLNLLSNAVKFTERGTITFSVQNVSRRPGRNIRLRFSVRDSGIGIDRHLLKAIFLPFHQLDNNITRAEGTGLGLTISQRLIRLMGSKLCVTSEIGQGSLFWFSLDMPVVGTALLAASTKESQSDEEAITLPDAVWVSQLREQVRRHNILGIRELMEQLNDHSEYRAFCEQIHPFIQHYRFKPLLEWLDHLMPVARLSEAEPPQQKS